jgi:hypothetical protein
MIKIDTHNRTTCTYPEQHDRDAMEAVMEQWTTTGGVPADYVRALFNGSFATTDEPFGLPRPSTEKMAALVAGINSAKAGEIVDLGSFSRYADDDVDEG